MCDKPWDHPWSMDEFIENSENWSLAGDVALLNTLKAFGDDLIKKTNEINGNLHNLTNRLEETELHLNLARNEFQALRNTQFIESRVYEDDEGILEAPTIEKEEPQGDNIEAIRKLALKSLSLIDRYYDKVDVSVSDSEDEDIDLPKFLLRSKDMYLDRPLPYVIGTEEWHKSAHVGLEDSGDSSESELEESFSESESNSSNRDESAAIKDSDSSELEYSKIPVEVPVLGRNFAEQLAAKLGEFAEPEINTRPIQTKKAQPQYDGLLFDEPPPLDDAKGLFSKGAGLFDDEDESPQEDKGVKSDLFGDSSDEGLFVEKKEPPQDEKKPTGGVSIFGGANLFDKKLLKRHPSSSSEDEFKDAQEKVGKIEKTVNLFDDDEDTIEDDLFKSIPIEKPAKTVDLFDDNEITQDIPKSTPIKKSAVSLFDDEDLFKSDIFATKPKFASSLFDDDEVSNFFYDNSEEVPKVEEKIERKPLSVDLFGSSPDTNDDLFSNLDKKTTVPKTSLFDSASLKDEDLFGPQEGTLSKISLFGEIPPLDDLTVSSDEEPLSDNEGFNEEVLDTPKIGIFDEEPPLFGHNMTKNVVDYGEEKQEKVREKKVGIFDELPIFSRNINPVDETDDFRVENKPNIVGKTELFGELSRDTNPVDASDDFRVETKPKIAGKTGIFGELSRETNPVDATDDFRVETKPKIAGKTGIFGELSRKTNPVDDIDDFRAENKPKIVGKTRMFGEISGDTNPVDASDDFRVETKPKITGKTGIFGELSRDTNPVDATADFGVDTKLKIAGKTGIFGELSRDTNPVDEIDDFRAETKPKIVGKTGIFGELSGDTNPVDAIDDFRAETKPKFVGKTGMFGELSQDTNPVDDIDDFRAENKQKIDGKTGLFGELSRDTNPVDETDDFRVETKPKIAGRTGIFGELSRDTNPVDKIKDFRDKNEPKIVGKTGIVDDISRDTNPIDALFANDDEDEDDLFQSPKTTLKSTEKLKSLFDSDPEEDLPTPTNPPKLKIPGKLTHNLKINVGALMPGSAPPKKNEIPTETTPEIEETPKVNTPSSVEVLQCVTKDRAKPLNRRPSTRRGRKVALRTSGVDFKLESEEPIDNKPKEKEEIRSGNDDLLGDKTPVLPTASKQTKKSLFDDDEDSDEDLFSTANVIRKAIPEKKVPKLAVKKTLNTEESEDDPLSALLK